MHEKRFLIAQILAGFTFMATAGCGGSANNPSALGEAPTLSGSIKGWIQGAAPLTAYVDTSHGKSPQTKAAIATGAIDGSANFSITLPGRETMEAYLQPFAEVPTPRCPSPSYEISDPDVREAIMYGFIGGADIAVLPIDIIVPSKHIIYVNYVYVDKDVTLSGDLGSQKCDVQLSAGWNVYQNEVNNDGPVYLQYRTGELPPETRWQVGL